MLSKASKRGIRMKKKILLFAFVLVLTTISPMIVQAETDTNLYVDVVEEDWFYKYTMYAYENGWMTGMSDHVFAPCEFVSRAQFVEILYRLEGRPEISDGICFYDVPQDAWYVDAVSWAAEKMIISGYEDGSFGPADAITREQLAVILHRYAGYIGRNMNESVDMSIYTDAIHISGFAKGAVSWCAANHIIKGTDGSLNPIGNTTRAECVAMVYRFLEDESQENEKGQFIVQYADQFVGNPYRWGGDDLYNGIDCSHFVYRVLKNCGVYDGEYVTSSGWRNKGMPVASLAEAQAGDVICYSGHVAIYDGRGLLVEAKCADEGITHNRSVGYKEIIAIRRFV